MASPLVAGRTVVCQAQARLLQNHPSPLPVFRCTAPRKHVVTRRYAALASAQKIAEKPAAPSIAAAACAALLYPVTQFLSAIKQAFANAVKDINVEDLTQQAKVLRKQFKMYRMALPFAAVSSTTNTFILVSKAIGSFVKLYLLLLFVRVLLSWFPNFSWENQPWLALRQVTDPYLNLFRGLVPPLMGSMDFTPLFGFLILQFLAAALDLDDGSEGDW